MSQATMIVCMTSKRWAVNRRENVSDVFNLETDEILKETGFLLWRWIMMKRITEMNFVVWSRILQSSLWHFLVSSRRFTDCADHFILFILSYIEFWVNAPFLPWWIFSLGFFRSRIYLWYSSEHLLSILIPLFLFRRDRLRSMLTQDELSISLSVFFMTPESQVYRRVCLFFRWS